MLRRLLEKWRDSWLYAQFARFGNFLRKIFGINKQEDASSSAPAEADQESISQDALQSNCVNQDIHSDSQFSANSHYPFTEQSSHVYGETLREPSVYSYNSAANYNPHERNPSFSSINTARDSIGSTRRDSMSSLTDGAHSDAEHDIRQSEYRQSYRSLGEHTSADSSSDAELLSYSERTSANMGAAQDSFRGSSNDLMNNFTDGAHHDVRQAEGGQGESTDSNIAPTNHGPLTFAHDHEEQNSSSESASPKSLDDDRRLSKFYAERRRETEAEIDNLLLVGIMNKDNQLKKRALRNRLDEKQAKLIHLDPDSPEISLGARYDHLADQLKVLYADRAVLSGDLSETRHSAAGVAFSTPMRRNLDKNLVQLKFISFGDVITDSSMADTKHNAATAQNRIRDNSKSQLKAAQKEWERRPGRPVDISCLDLGNIFRANIQELLVSRLVGALGGAKLAPVLCDDPWQNSSQAIDPSKSVWPPEDRVLGQFTSKYIGHPNTVSVKQLSEFAPVIHDKARNDVSRDEKSMRSISGAASELAYQFFLLGNRDINDKNFLVEQIIENGKITNKARVIDYGLALGQKNASASDALYVPRNILFPQWAYDDLPMDIDLFKSATHDALRSFAINGDRKCGLSVGRINDLMAIGVERLKQAVECRWSRVEWEKKARDIRSKYDPIDVEGFWAAVTTGSGPATTTARGMANYIKSPDGVAMQINDADIGTLSGPQKCAYYVKLRCMVDPIFEACVQRTELMTQYERQSAELVGGKYALTMEHFMELLQSEINLQQAIETTEQYTWLGIDAMTKQNVDCLLQNCYTMQAEMAPLLDIVRPDDKTGMEDEVSKDWFKTGTETCARITEKAGQIHSKLEEDHMLYNQIASSSSYLDILDEICDAPMAQYQERKQASRAKIARGQFSGHEDWSRNEAELASDSGPRLELELDSDLELDSELRLDDVESDYGSISPSLYSSRILRGTDEKSL